MAAKKQTNKKPTTKNQPVITNEQAIAKAKAFYEQLEMKKKATPSSTAAAPKVSPPNTRGKGLPPTSHPVVQPRSDDDEAKAKGQAYFRDLMEKEQMKRDGLKKGPVETRSKSTACGTFSVAPVPSHTSCPTTQERLRLRQFYMALLEKEDQKKQQKFRAAAAASSYLPSPNDRRSNVPSTVFCGASYSLPRSQLGLNAEATYRVQQFYESLNSQEEQKRGSSSVESVASSVDDSEAPFVPFLNTRRHFSGHYQESKATKRLGNVPHSLRQRVIDGLAIFAACFLVKNFSVVFPSLLGKIFLYAFQQMGKMALTCGSIALKALVVSFMASVVFMVGRFLWQNVLMVPTNDAPKQFHQDVESIKVLVYHELMTQPDVGVAEGSLRDAVLSRLTGDMIRDRRAVRQWSEPEKKYWKESVWSEAVTQLKQEPRILKLKVRVGHDIETIWSWSDVPTNGTHCKKRKVY